MKKTILFTVLAGASVGLVGCGSSDIATNTPNIGDNVIIKDYGAGQHKDKKVDYINKSNLDFEIYEYGDEFTGLEIAVSKSALYSDDAEEDGELYLVGEDDNAEDNAGEWELNGIQEDTEEDGELYLVGEDDDTDDSDESVEPYESIMISFPLVNKDDSVFKEQLKIAIGSVKGTEIDYEKVLEKISELTSDKYLKKIKAEDLVYDDYSIRNKIISNSKVGFDIDLSINNIGKYNSNVVVEISTKSISNYVKESGLKFNYALYFNEETGLRIAHGTDSYDSEGSIEFVMPVERMDDAQLREQLEIAAKSIGIASKDVEAVYEIMSNNKSKDVSETIDGERYTINVSNNLDTEYDDPTFCIDIYYV